MSETPAMSQFATQTDYWKAQADELRSALEEWCEAFRSMNAANAKAQEVLVRLQPYRSDTPRTNTLREDAAKNGYHWTNAISLCEELERELAYAKAQR